MRCNAYSPEHTHETVEETRQCWYRKCHPVVTPPPPPAPVSSAPFAPGSWRNDKVSDAQLAKIERLGGDAVHAAKLTKGEASDYIRALIKDEPYRPSVAAPAPTPQPAPPRQQRQEDPKLKLVKGMIDMVPDGNYATAPMGENRHSDFVRLVQRKSGKYRGCRLIQTRHAETLKDRIIIHPSGWWEITPGGYKVIDMLMEIIQDWKTCATRYAVASKSCFHCATALTDDRSRHYLVGPICEKQHGITWSVEFADEWNGFTYEQLVARGMELNKHHASFLSVA